MSRGPAVRIPIRPCLESVLNASATPGYGSASLLKTLLPISKTYSSSDFVGAGLKWKRVSRNDWGKRVGILPCSWKRSKSRFLWKRSTSSASNPRFTRKRTSLSRAEWYRPSRSQSVLSASKITQSRCENALCLNKSRLGCVTKLAATLSRCACMTGTIVARANRAQISFQPPIGMKDESGDRCCPLSPSAVDNLNRGLTWQIQVSGATICGSSLSDWGTQPQFKAFRRTAKRGSYETQTSRKSL